MDHSFAVKAMRAYLQGLSLFSRDAATSAAAKLYTTPPRGKPKGARDRELFAEARAGEFLFRGSSLPYWEWGESSLPKILLVHGWGAGPWLFSPLIRALLGGGYAVVTYAGPGHERKHRYPTTAMTWVHAFRAITAKVGPLYGLIGHSLGAATIVCAAQRDLSVKRIVLFSACTDLVENTDEFMQLFAFGREAAESMRAKIWSDYRMDCEPLASNWQDLYITTSNVPTLLIHDKQDPVLRPTHSTRVAERWGNATLHLTEGLGHFALVRNAEIVQRTLAFLR